MGKFLIQLTIGIFCMWGAFSPYAILLGAIIWATQGDPVGPAYIGLGLFPWMVWALAWATVCLLRRNLTRRAKRLGMYPAELYFQENPEEITPRQLAEWERNNRRL